MNQPKPRPADAAPAAADTGGVVPNLDTTRIDDPGAPLRLEVGAVPVPDYRLVQFLGRGGFGEVWKAVGPGDFAVALKFITLGADAGAAEERSAELLRSKDIRHPNLLGLFGSWRRHGLLILAMELADRTLMDRFNEIRAQGLCGVPFAELRELLREAAKGLDHLHSIGVQHRDVKPQNLLLVGGGVKVADFGLAKVLEQTTASNSGAMTPAYAAPEFLKGRVSPHSDQYSLAVAYVQLRGGRLPYNGGPAQLMMGHLYETPDLTALPEAERPAVMKALAKDPDERYPSCRAFVEAVAAAGRAAAAAKTISPTPPKPAPPPHRKPTTAVPTAPRPAVHATRCQAAPAPRPAIHAVRRQAAPAPRRGRPWPALILAGLLLLAVVAAVVALPFVLNRKPPAAGSPPATHADPPPTDGGAPAAVRAAIKTGRDHLDRDEWAQARDSFGAAIALDSKNAEAYAWRAEANDSDRRYDDALADADKAIELDPKSALGHAYRAEILADKDDLDTAIRDADRAVELDPQSAVARRCRGSVHIVRDEPDEALRDFDEAIRLDPTYPDPYVGRGNARLAADRDDDALKDFNQVVALAPQSSAGYVGLSAYHIKHKAWGLAMDDLNRAVQAAPQDADALVARGDFRRSRDEPDGAAADFRAAIRLNPRMPDPHVYLADLYADKDTDRAIEEYTEAIDLDARNAGAFNGRGWRRYRQDDYDAAVEDFGKALALDAKYADALAGRGFSYHAMRKYDLALADLNASLKIAPKEADNFRERGDVYYDQEKYAKAIDDYTQAISLSPGVAQFYLNRAGAYEANGDADKAEADRKKADELKNMPK